LFGQYIKDIYEIVCHDSEISMKSFNDWWKTIPEDLRNKSRKGDEANKPLLNQVNYVLLNLHLAGKHDAKPTHDELRDWLHSGQVDVLRMTAK
jgi:hypothetical protein